MTDRNFQSVELLAVHCLQIIRKYSWLLDSFVLDFYTEDHWKQMPKSWQCFLLSVTPEELGDWISTGTETKCMKVWPLSLLALRRSVQVYMLPRNPSPSNSTYICLNSTLEWLDVNLENNSATHQDNADEHLDTKAIGMNPPSSTGVLGKVQAIPHMNSPGRPTCCLTNPSLKNLFIKHVKPKKRHEILAMAKVCARTAQHTNSLYIVDVGAGKGHLSRLLAYGYGLKACCLEAQNELTQTAKKLDAELEYTAGKHVRAEELAAVPKPIHINIILDPTKNAEDFVNELRAAYDVPADKPFRFGVVGLHPCGDLAPTLLRLFTECPEAKFITVVGCCYMKLTLESDGQNETTYPLSSFFLSKAPSMVSQSYEALEIACHAIEEYSKRLQSHQYSDLKIHNYRAVLEKIIVGLYPDKRRLGLRSVKHAHKMKFEEYVKVAIGRAGLEIPDQALNKAGVQDSLERWIQVVVFYSLRLLVAPLVETAVLLDRLLFLGQQGYECCLLPGFDPFLSPRNHILLGCKR